MRFISIGIAAVVAAGCATTPAAPAPPARSAQDYYPLAVGNRWTYEIERLGEKRTETIEIVGREGGFFVDSMGGKLTIDGFGVRDDKRYLLQEPIRPEHAWKNTVSVSATERYQILSVGATCDVPAGTFEDCVTVASTLRIDQSSALVNELTFARGVGLVKLEVDLNQAGRRIPQHRMTLQSYQLASEEPK